MQTKTNILDPDPFSRDFELSTQDELNVWYWLGVWDPILKLFQGILVDPWLKPAFLAHLRGIGRIQRSRRKHKIQKRNEINPNNNNKNGMINNENIEKQQSLLNGSNLVANIGNNNTLTPGKANGIINDANGMNNNNFNDRGLSPDPLNANNREYKEVNAEELEQKLAHKHRRTQSMNSSEMLEKERKHIKYYDFILWFVRHAALAYVVNGGKLDVSIKSLYYRFAGWLTTWWFDVLFPIDIRKFCFVLYACICSYCLCLDCLEIVWILLKSNRNGLLCF